MSKHHRGGSNDLMLVRSSTQGHERHGSELEIMVVSKATGRQGARRDEPYNYNLIFPQIYGFIVVKLSTLDSAA